VAAIALVDVNNFYASCEQLFDARLVGRPVVVGTQMDDVITNEVTLAGESRIAFATTIPVAFCKITLT
jgi:DNA polymerase V